MIDDERKGETPIEWGVKKYWKEKTDEQLAIGLNTTIEVIRETRQFLGLVRPVNQKSMKEFAREYIMNLTDLEKIEFLRSIDPELVWKMAEGNPASTGELTVNTEPIKIDITHTLDKIYEPRIIDTVSTDGEGRRLSARSGK